MTIETFLAMKAEIEAKSAAVRAEWDAQFANGSCRNLPHDLDYEGMILDRQERETNPEV